MAKNASDRALETAQEFLDDLNIQSISDSVTQEYHGLDFTTFDALSLVFILLDA